MILQDLADTAAADAETMRTLAAQGDIREKTRAVDFFIDCESLQMAKDISAYLSAGGYANAKVDVDEDSFRVTATVAMALVGSHLLTTSGLLLCISRLFRAEYSGWGTLLQKE
jgi:hypothetical protein